MVGWIKNKPKPLSMMRPNWQLAFLWALRRSRKAEVHPLRPALPSTESWGTPSQWVWTDGGRAQSDQKLAALGMCAGVHLHFLPPHAPHMLQLSAGWSAAAMAARGHGRLHSPSARGQTRLQLVSGCVSKSRDHFNPLQRLFAPAMGWPIKRIATLGEPRAVHVCGWPFWWKSRDGEGVMQTCACPCNWAAVLWMSALGCMLHGGWASGQPELVHPRVSCLGPL